MRRKFYVETGEERHLLTSDTPYTAAIKVIKNIISGKRSARFGVLVWVGEKGFVTDLEKDKEVEALDKCRTYSFYSILVDLGEKEIAAEFKPIEDKFIEQNPTIGTLLKGFNCYN